MATFTISVPASDRLRTAGVTGKDEVSYTVTNSKPTPARATFRIVPKDSTQRAWLSPDDGSDRDFRAGESQQFKVSIAIPTATPASVFGFRVDVANVADPARDCVEGDWVEVKWNGAAKPTNGKHTPIGLIIAIIAVVVVIGVVLAVVLHGRGETATTQTTTQQSQQASSDQNTPDFGGKGKMGMTEAEEKVQSSGLHASIQIRADTSLPVGAVVAQQPLPGQPLPADKGVTLFINPTTIPNVLNGGVVNACNALNGAFLAVGQITGTDSNKVVRLTSETGTVLAPGKPMVPGTTVAIVLDGSPVKFNPGNLSLKIDPAVLRAQQAIRNMQRNMH
jgi:hypothetical protein